MRPNFINRPCVIRRQVESGGSGPYGGKATEAEEVEALCDIQQVQRLEDAAQTEDLSDTRWAGYFLPEAAEALTEGATVITSDDGKAYEVIGEPWLARNPRTRQAEHVEASLRRAGASDEGAGS